VYKVTTPHPVISATVSSKPTEEDRIGPVGTNYVPVSLPKPKKLVNPFEKMAQGQQEQENVSSAVKRGGGMTWSERQALAKKHAEEEEAQSRSASAQIPATTSNTTKWNIPPTAHNVARISKRDDDDAQDEDDWDAVRLTLASFPYYSC
jgi:Skp family chaperone for outer membrane proteins